MRAIERLAATLEVSGREGVKVAFVGKGGSGKSALAGTLCRQLARQHGRVLALDLDTMAGSALSIGLDTDGARLPSGLAEASRRGKAGN